MNPPHFFRPLLGACSASVLFFAGCATAPETRTIDSKGPEALNTASINSQDWASAADQLVQSLLTSNALDRVRTQPAVLAVDRIINNTTLSVDTDLLIKKIRVALTQTGKVAVTNTMGLGERAVVASEAAEMEEMTTGKKQKLKAPDFTLYGKLIQQTDRAKSVTQNTYTFQMSLVDVKSGLTVWEEEREIAKQTKRSSVGW
ncbi:penicillin-binding protein activator LpoB [Horticoccus luteus]|uniref:Penicillin-binding protein activator LpoB n=1 Tax=Horticoccus luteus TaxID=2862869 RepID=A0A8F9TUT7_9BACT|nr:penicillin-binding protein activator LpoB [Horticoccus luteus]QYM79501.1 penicillin-binding protein activator LpoB [Horticoccus luteus]